MARTKLSVTKALKRKKVDLNASDVNENDITAKVVKISIPRTKALIKDKKHISSVCTPLLMPEKPTADRPSVARRMEILELVESNFSTSRMENEELVASSPTPSTPSAVFPATMHSPIPSIVVTPPSYPANDSLEVLEVGGEAITEEVNANEDDLVEGDETMEVENSQKVKRGKNFNFEFTKSFESETKFQEYWNDSDLHTNFKKCDRKATSTGKYIVYRCIFGKKSGYKVCPSKVKIVYPDDDNTVIMYSIPENHCHEKVDGNNKEDRFSWKANVEADDIAREGVKHNDTPGQIRLQMQKSGIFPLPTTRQINNHVKTLRKENFDKRLVIGNTEELRNAIADKIDEPEDFHEPFINFRDIIIYN